MAQEQIFSLLDSKEKWDCFAHTLQKIHQKHHHKPEQLVLCWKHTNFRFGLICLPLLCELTSVLLLNLRVKCHYTSLKCEAGNGTECLCAPLWLWVSGQLLQHKVEQRPPPIYVLSTHCVSPHPAPPNTHTHMLTHTSWRLNSSAANEEGGGSQMSPDEQVCVNLNATLQK